MADKQDEQWTVSGIANLWYPEDGDFLLFEVASVLLVDEDEVQVVPRAELLVDITERRREVESAEEQPDRNRLSWKTMHFRVSGGSFAEGTYLARVRRP